MSNTESSVKLIYEIVGDVWGKSLWVQQPNSSPRWGRGGLCAREWNHDLVWRWDVYGWWTQASDFWAEIAASPQASLIGRAGALKPRQELKAFPFCETDQCFLCKPPFWFPLSLVMSSIFLFFVVYRRNSLSSASRLFLFKEPHRTLSDLPLHAFYT